MKKFLSMTVLLLIIVLAGCQKDQTTKPKQKTNTNDAKVVKTEKLEDDELRGFLREYRRRRLEKFRYHTSCGSEDYSSDRKLFSCVK